MSEIIVKMKSDYIKIKGGEYIRDLVRCKDCKHRDTNECPYDTVNYMLADWDFCSSGERSDE